MPLPRRQILRAAAASLVLSTALLGGCSSGSHDGGVSGPTWTIKDVDDKDVTIPERPERVVTLSEPATDSALALGVTPIGIVSGRGQSSVSNYLKDKGEGTKGQDIEILGGVANPDYEKIGAAKPDLILVDGTSINNNQEALDKLAAIAPLVYTGYAGGKWKDNFSLVATALNKEAEGQKLLSGYDQRVKDVGGQLKKKGYGNKTFSIVRWQGSAPALVLKELPPGQALTDLGLKRPKSQNRDGRGHSDPVSLENIATIDADYMFFGTLGGSSVNNPDAGGAADAQAGQESLAGAMSTPGFSALTAVKDKHVFPVDGSLWTSTGGYYLMNTIVDEVSEILIDQDGKGSGGAGASNGGADQGDSGRSGEDGAGSTQAPAQTPGSNVIQQG
ncbi:ABC transporter substrate-binding protein [Brevibacterium sp. BRM-1]|uniref:ABC transporter substrate-binding protein n=1 Tax=Brevibacterium sp. BRM-1 TaxID=2999062 RepID=UPI002280A5D5|nr:ABC transporter substrate-binding protein [Brevibacterium sp. BRM-1]WAL41474.1 ABC transporter substrate-binding protein [Brevibacterium sp. BRM-1]